MRGDTVVFVNRALIGPARDKSVCNLRIQTILLLTLTGCACRSSGARYLITTSPIDVGLGIRLCVAVDPRDETGLWWWGEGASGCRSRSTGPDLFRAEQARITRARGIQPWTAAFRLGTHSAAQPYIDVTLLIQGTTLHSTQSNDRVPLEDRKDLAIPEQPPRGRPSR
jgi:hypothetical protein